MRPVSCPESPRNTLNVPDRAYTDDFMINKPSVHFKIAPAPRRKTADATISLAKKNEDTNYSLTDLSYQDRDMEGLEINPNDQFRHSRSGRRDSLKSIYPELPRTKPSPAPRRFIHKSENDLDKPTDSVICIDQPLVNPRSYHKGLLRVVSSAQTSPSKIPRRKSSISGPTGMSSSRKNSISMSTGNLSSRDKSASPKRKPSVDLGGSMIDLGVVSSAIRSASRISKPTTLSPIIGTPNRDVENENMVSDKSPDQSPTKIPIRRSSSVNINGSRNSSRASSREHSPPKSTTRSPTKIPQKLSQRSSQLDNKTNKKQMTGSKASTSKADKTGTLRREASDLKKLPPSARKEATMTNEKSSARKPLPHTLKRETSTLKKQPSALKREPSNLRLTPSSTLKRESSNVGKKLPASSATLSKNQSDSSLTKRLDKKNSFKQKRRTSSESDGLNEISTANNDSLIPLGTTAVSMATSIINQPSSSTNQLNKTNSSGQITSNSNSNVNSSMIPLGGDDFRKEMKPTVMETTEKAQKMADTTDTTTTATDNIQKMTVENTMEIKLGEMNDANTADNTAATAPLQKNPSSRTLKSDIILNDDKVVVKTEEITATALPIEAEVNVINKDENNGDVSNDTDNSNIESTMLLKQDNDEMTTEHTVTQTMEMEADSSNDLVKQAVNGVKSSNLIVDSSTGAKNEM